MRDESVQFPKETGGPGGRANLLDKQRVDTSREDRVNRAEGWTGGRWTGGPGGRANRVDDGRVDGWTGGRWTGGPGGRLDRFTVHSSKQEDNVDG